MEFEYKVINNEIEITSYLENQPAVIVPAAIEGLPVTVIGRYAFEGKNELLEVTLPETLKEIGAHAFYNCRRLRKISITDRVFSIEDGAFKNCRDLQHFHIQVMIRKMTCLNNMLSELNQEIHVTMEYKDTGMISKLVFPSYLYDYEDNVSAKIINQVTYGSGVHYRECMKEREVDFKKYDEVFRVAKQNDSLKTLFTIAYDRLEFPSELGKEAEMEYRNFIEEHFQEIIVLCVKNDDCDRLLFLGEAGFFTRENIDFAIQAAHESEHLECVSVLLEYKNKHFKAQKKTFDL